MISSVLAAAASAEPSPWLSAMPLLIVAVIFWLVAFGPMVKRQRALQKLIAGLERGDKVVTTGGLCGEIAAIEGQMVWLKIADKVKVKVLKSAITGLEEQQQQGVTK